MGQSVICLLFVLFSFVSCYGAKDVNNSDPTKSTIHIGVVLDQNSPLGTMLEFSMKMALSDFYSAHPNYMTRLQLNIKNADSVVDANFAVLELLNHDEVHGILGPQDEMENIFVTELGRKVLVPIISFTSRSSIPSFSDNPYFVRVTSDNAMQVQAIAAICKGYEWPEVVVLYEDTDYGNRFLSQLNRAFQEVEVGLAYTIAIPTLTEDGQLLKELKNIMARQTRVFLVHMNPSLGYRFFALAKGVGVMTEGYAWLVTDSLSNFISSIDSVTRDSLEGVLGLRPYIYQSKELKDLQIRWKRYTMFLDKYKDSTMELNVYGVWVYDAVTALAISVGKIGPVNSTSWSVSKARNATGDRNCRISAVGPRLVTELSAMKFRGLSGDFELVNGRLNQSVFEIFNVYGSGEKTVGFWTSDRGIRRELSPNGERTYSTSTKNLKTVIWPGDSIMQPKGWAIPATGKLRVGVPWKTGFNEFVKATVDPVTKRTNATGFAIDIFLAAIDIIPFPLNYEFELYNGTENIDWSFDDMLHEIPKSFDMVVGDTTIRAPRATYVAFSLPYSESGAVLVVKNSKPIDMWIFIKPLRWDLWLAITVACILMGIILRIMEHGVTRNHADRRVASQIERPGWTYLSPVAVLAFPESNMVTNKWSHFTLVFWMFMAFILMQSYTANLSAILTVDQLKFAFSDNYNVGYQSASFMKHFLTEQLHISSSRLRSYESAEDYHHAMTVGSKNGGIDAIFDEIPYMKLLLNKYDSQYKMVGPTYKTGGFAFAFPVGSPLVEHFSKAILDVTQGPDLTAFEQKNFGPGYSSQDPLSSTISQGTASLTLYEFAGLFIIVGSVTLFSLFCSSTHTGKMLTDHAVQFIDSCMHCKSSKVNSVGGASAEAGEEQINGEAADENIIVESEEDSNDDEIHEVEPSGEREITAP